MDGRPALQWEATVKPEGAASALAVRGVEDPLEEGAIAAKGL
jgi:hypothetical protein